MSWVEIFLKINKLPGTFIPDTRILRNVAYNNNSTQYQNIFQPTARDLLGISSVNTKFPTESVP